MCSDLKEIIRVLQLRYDIELLVPSEDQKLLLEFRRDHVLEFRRCFEACTEKEVLSTEEFKGSIMHALCTDSSG